MQGVPDTMKFGVVQKMRILVLIIISIVVYWLTYLAGGKKGRAAFCGAMAAVIAFLGPYVVEYFDGNKSPKQEIEGNSQFNYAKDQVNIADESENEQIDSENNEKPNKDEHDETEGESNAECISFMGENHEPSGAATNVNVSGWKKDSDYDIAGKTYDGGVKITIYDMFSALDGNSSNISNEITSEIYYALNSDEISKLSEDDQHFAGKFVIGKETDGSPSTAVISILIDGREVYNSGEVNCYSLDIPAFDGELSGKKEMVIKTVCQHKGNPLVIGMVDND